MKFDHIEVYVRDIKKYCHHLIKMFQGGNVVVLNEEGISMFTGPEGLNIEVKKRAIDQDSILSGFGCPCLRMEGAKSFIQDTLNYEIVDTRKDLQGYPVYFFKDYEGIMWHIKDIPGE